MYIQLDNIKTFFKTGKTGDALLTSKFNENNNIVEENDSEPEFVYPEDDIDKILADFNKPLPKKETSKSDSSRKFLIFFIAIMFILIANLYTSGIIHFMKLRIKNIEWSHYLICAAALTLAMFIIDWIFDISITSGDDVNLQLI